MDSHSLTWIHESNLPGVKITDVNESSPIYIPYVHTVKMLAYFSSPKDQSTKSPNLTPILIIRRHFGGHETPQFYSQWNGDVYQIKCVLSVDIKYIIIFNPYSMFCHCLCSFLSCWESVILHHAMWVCLTGWMRSETARVVQVGVYFLEGSAVQLHS